MKTYPLLKTGTYGTHIIKNPAGTFCFVGSVPVALVETRCKTEGEAIDEFLKWFKTQPLDEQKKHVGDLRNDIFKLLFEGGTP